MTTAERLQNEGFDDVVIFDQNSYDDALVGVTSDGRAVYDYVKMVEWLVEYRGLTEEEAEEWVDYNTIEALRNAGDRGPIIMHPIPTRGEIAKQYSVYNDEDK